MSPCFFQIVRPSSLPGTDIEAPFRSSFPDTGGVEARRRRLYSSSSSPLFILCSSSVSYFVVIKLSSLFRTGMCLFSKEIRSPCSSFTSSRLHRNLDDSVTSRSIVVCQEVLKMIFISSNIELQIYGLKLVSLRTYKCTGSTQSVGELTGSVRLSPVATIPRLTVATAPPLTVDAELTRSGRLFSTASPSPPTETTSPPWVYRLPYLERVTISRVLVPPPHCVFASPNRKEAPRIHLARELDCPDGIKPPPPDAQRPSPNADSRSIKFFKFVDSSALSSSSIIFRVTVKVKAIPVSDLSTGLRFSLGFRESYGYRYGNIGVLPLSLTSAPIPPLSISFNYLNRSLFLLWNEDVVLSLMLFLPQFEDVAGSVGFFMKLYLPQYEDITLWCTSFLPKYEVIWTFAFVVLVSIISGLLSWQWWSSSQLSDFIKHGFVVFVFVAVRSPAVHVKILSTDLVNGMWFKAFKFGGFGWSIYGKGEARDSQGSSISLSAGSSLANEAGKMIKALQSAKTCRLSSLQLILDSIVLSSAMRSWLDMIKITGLLFRNLVTLFTPLSCTFNQCAATCFAVTFTMSVVSKLCSLITQF
ncbi:hypothetical protein IGI04_025817 [Brassica rapa subsp. trilocularis]|uniref:RNase H type-1 domain-containing protein n=1 Tax=Brassica rapa subsp. trilocularis TaxID=1813537 RepID=A0ABQ7KWV9_BRACM|nr:hypothetical protein IGI04_025817 [Brassica rapa subsp. trilocularis]